MVVNSFKVSFMILIASLILCGKSISQVTVGDEFLKPNAKANDPLFTNYAAAISRSFFFADKSYFMNYFTSDKPITYSSQYAGDFTVIWKVNNMVISNIRDYAKQPVVIASFPDMAILEYEPFQNIKVQEVFFVYTSGSAIIELTFENTGNIPYDIMLYSLVYMPEDSMQIMQYDESNQGYVFTHYEPYERLHSNLYKERGYPSNFLNLLSCNTSLQSYGAYNVCDLDQFYFDIKRLSKVHENVIALNEQKSGLVNIAALQKNIKLQPREKTSVRFIRSVQDERSPESELITDSKSAKTIELQKYVDENIELFKTIPRIQFKTAKEKIVYIGAFNLVRQCMLPPSGQTPHNFYVFSRNPVWGWGHGHQVMHESLSMIPYAYLDPISAQASQRVYIEQQYEDGLIAYRHGPRGPQVYPHEGIPSTSAPFFSWTNWEIYIVSKNKIFLKECYDAGSKYIRYLEKERDQDQEGMDEGRDISHELDVLDLTSEVANEMFYLKSMAKELGDSAGIREWAEKFDKTAKLINKFMWDRNDKFYYNLSM